MIFRFFILLFASFVFVESCQKDETYFAPEIIDSLSGTASHSLFSTADSLRWLTQFEEAKTAYNNIIFHIGLSRREYLYVSNQLAFCNLKLFNWVAADSILNGLGNADYQSLNQQEIIYADFLFNRACLLMETNRQSAEAISLLEKAGSIYENIYPNDHLKKVSLWLKKAEALRFYSNRIDSVSTYLNLVDVVLQRHPILAHYVPDFYYLNADACWRNRDYSKGMANISKALEIALTAPNKDTLLIARSYSLKGKILQKQGNNKDAESNYLQGLKLGVQLSPLPEKAQSLYSDLLIFYSFEQDSTKFNCHIRNLIAAYPNKVLNLANINRLRGYYAYLGQDYRATAKYFQAALNNYREERIMDAMLYDQAYYILGDALAKLGYYEEAAETVIQNLMPIGVQKERIRPWEWVCSGQLEYYDYSFVVLHQLASFYLLDYQKNLKKEKSLNRAFILYSKLDTLLFSQMQSVDEDAVMTFLKDYGVDIYEQGIEVCHALYKIKKDGKYIDWAMKFIDRTKYSLSHREQLSNKNIFFKEVPPSVFLEEKNIAAEIRKIKFQLSRDVSGQNGEEYDLLRAALNRQEKLFLDIKLKYPRYFQSKIFPSIPDLCTIQEKLDSNSESLLQFHYGKKNIFTLFVSKKNVRFYRMEKPNGFDQTLLNWYNCLANPDSIVARITFCRLGYDIYKALVAPVLIQEIGSAQSLVIVPDQALNILPFEALLTKSVSQAKFEFRSLPYLFIERPIRYSPSLKSYFQETKELLPSSPAVLAYAFSDKGKNGTTQYRHQLSELPGSFKELQQIQQNFGKKGTFCFGNESRLQHFLTNCKKHYDILHFALHADSDPHNRWNTKLYFRPQNPSDTTNRLYAFEIIPMPLDARLAVLTSCQTFTGTLEEGEGTISLAQAFLQAGVGSVVASLWSVEDYSTSMLSNDFYSNLKKREMPSTALQHAKLDYLRREDDFWTHPRFWAGMVCMGK